MDLITRLRLSTANWLAEEASEAAEAALTADGDPNSPAYNDALLDTLGITLCELITLSEQQRASALELYLAAQSVRGRRLDVPHIAMIKRLLADMDGYVDVSSTPNCAVVLVTRARRYDDVAHITLAETNAQFARLSKRLRK